MHLPSELKDELTRAPRRWLVTGAAGFIGSNLVEALLRLGQEVVGLDNFATGYAHNLEEAISMGGEGARERFTFQEGDIRDLEACREACQRADIVLHQAALGSVPRSIKDPLATHQVNVDGFVNMLMAAREAGVRRFVFASSSSVYGDHPGLPKVESEIGIPLSPYAVSKRTNELYARTFQDHYGLETVGLRYFNVFGRRQDPHGAYAAVIPKWIEHLVRGEACYIHGDGETSRDFCYIDNVVQANLRAALAPSAVAQDVYNIACGERTTLNDLHGLISGAIGHGRSGGAAAAPLYGPFRHGDIRHSLADISRAVRCLGYSPTHSAGEGIGEAIEWYLDHLQAERMPSSI